MKVEHLTFTRFMAAMLVVLFHAGATKLPPDTIMGSLLGVGNSAVSYFFVLSGFILVVSNARGGQLPAQLRRGEFWRNRFARIYPLYLFALALTILLGVWTSNDKIAEMSVGSVAASTALVQAWLPQFVMQLNYPGWSLSVETLFYALFPVLYLSISRQSTKAMLPAVGVFWALSLTIFANMTNAIQPGQPNTTALHDLTLYFPPLHLGTFVVGIATGIVFVRHRAWLLRNHRWLTVALVTLLLSNLWIVLGHLPPLAYHHNGLFAPLFAVFILWMSTQTNGFTRWLSRPLPVHLGEISYGIYLLQVPVGMCTFWVNYHYLHWPIWLYLPIYISLLLTVSTVCYRVVEQPARRLIRQWTAPVLAGTAADEQLSRQS